MVYRVPCAEYNTLRYVCKTHITIENVPTHHPMLIM